MSDIHFIWHVRAANPRIFHWMLFPPALLFIDHSIWSQRVYFFGWSRAPGPLPISFISARLPTSPITGWTRLFVYRYTYTMKEQLLSAVCVYAAQFVGRNRFYLIIKACMNHEFSMSGDFRHFLSPIRCFCPLYVDETAISRRGPPSFCWFSVVRSTRMQLLQPGCREKCVLLHPKLLINKKKKKWKEYWWLPLRQS